MTILLTQRVLQRLPSDVSPTVFSFLGIRKDWRSCKKHESDIIAAYNDWTKRVLNDDALDWYYPGAKVEFPMMFSQMELDEYLDWSLCGRWYLILLTRDNFYWHQTRVKVYDPDMDYRDWYLWQFRWFHQCHRFK